MKWFRIFVRYKKIKFIDYLILTIALAPLGDEVQCIALRSKYLLLAMALRKRIAIGLPWSELKLFEEEVANMINVAIKKQESNNDKPLR